MGHSISLTLYSWQEMLKRAYIPRRAKGHVHHDQCHAARESGAVVHGGTVTKPIRNGEAPVTVPH